MTIETINIARQFARYPAGRYAKDGPYSGEEFRQKFLIPALNKNNNKILIQFDGARGLASSFLEEAFGGLVREGFSADNLLSRFEFQSKDPSLISEVVEYIKEQASTD